MTIYVVRAGKYGETEDQALEEGLCFIGWGNMPDLNSFESRNEIQSKLAEICPDQKEGTRKSHAIQIWTFLDCIKKGDIIALPLKNRPAIAFGEATDDYVYFPENAESARHAKKVKWIGEPILRSRFDQDLKYSFGASQTVFSVHRNDAENRIRKMLAEPDWKGTIIPRENDEELEFAPNLLNAASQQISDYIGRRFKGRKLEILVEAVLKAQGYETNLCPEGADGGVDILAGKGTMGFEQPRLCVQVKSSDSPVGTEVLSQLKGVMGDHQANHGLLVAWGGFKSTVIRESRRAFFNIRLWNDQKLVEEIQDVYEKLPKEIQAELPLQQAWVLVEEE